MDLSITHYPGLLRKGSGGRISTNNLNMVVFADQRFPGNQDQKNGQSRVDKLQEGSGKLKESRKHSQNPKNGVKETHRRRSSSSRIFVQRPTKSVHKEQQDTPMSHDPSRNDQNSSGNNFSSLSSRHLGPVYGKKMIKVEQEIVYLGKGGKVNHTSRRKKAEKSSKRQYKKKSKNRSQRRSSGVRRTPEAKGGLKTLKKHDLESFGEENRVGQGYRIRSISGSREGRGSVSGGRGVSRNSRRGFYSRSRGFREDMADGGDPSNFSKPSHSESVLRRGKDGSRYPGSFTSRQSSQYSKNPYFSPEIQNSKFHKNRQKGASERQHRGQKGHRRHPGGHAYPSNHLDGHENPKDRLFFKKTKSRSHRLHNPKKRNNGQEIGSHHLINLLATNTDSKNWLQARKKLNSQQRVLELENLKAQREQIQLAIRALEQDERDPGSSFQPPKTSKNPQNHLEANIPETQLWQYQGRYNDLYNSRSDPSLALMQSGGSNSQAIRSNYHQTAKNSPMAPRLSIRGKTSKTGLVFKNRAMEHAGGHQEPPESKETPKLPQMVENESHPKTNNNNNMNTSIVSYVNHDDNNNLLYKSALLNTSRKYLFSSPQLIQRKQFQNASSRHNQPENLSMSIQGRVRGPPINERSSLRLKFKNFKQSHQNRFNSSFAGYSSRGSVSGNGLSSSQMILKHLNLKSQRKRRREEIGLKSSIVMEDEDYLESSSRNHDEESFRGGEEARKHDMGPERPKKAVFSKFGAEAENGVSGGVRRVGGVSGRGRSRTGLPVYSMTEKMDSNNTLTSHPHRNPFGENMAIKHPEQAKLNSVGHHGANDVERTPNMTENLPENLKKVKKPKMALNQIKPPQMTQQSRIGAKRPQTAQHRPETTFSLKEFFFKKDTFQRSKGDLTPRKRHSRDIQDSNEHPRYPQTTQIPPKTQQNGPKPKLIKKDSEEPNSFRPPDLSLSQIEEPEYNTSYINEASFFNKISFRDSNKPPTVIHSNNKFGEGTGSGNNFDEIEGSQKAIPAREGAFFRGGGGVRKKSKFQDSKSFYYHNRGGLANQMKSAGVGVEEPDCSPIGGGRGRIIPNGLIKESFVLLERKIGQEGLDGREMGFAASLKVLGGRGDRLRGSGSDENEKIEQKGNLDIFQSKTQINGFSGGKEGGDAQKGYKTLKESLGSDEVHNPTPEIPQNLKNPKI